MWLRCVAAFPIAAVQLRYAALLPSGCAWRTPSDRQTAVVAGATGPLPKPGKASVAIAQDWGGHWTFECTGVDIQKWKNRVICHFCQKGVSNVIDLNCETRLGVLLSFQNILSLISKDLRILVIFLQ